MKNFIKINRTLAAKKTKLFSLFLAIMACMEINADVVVEGYVDGIYYVLYHDYTAEVAGYDEEISSNVVIPEAVAYDDNYAVTSIGYHAFEGCSSVVSVTIPNSVISIESGAFYSCSKLASIEIPSSVTSIGIYAFEDCRALTSIEIPNSVTNIRQGTFSGCKVLTSITIPNSVTSIGSYAFSDCSKLTSIDIPNSVTSIGEKAFSGCNSLPVVDNLRYADTYLVEAVDKTLTACNIMNGTRWIGPSAFAGCESLTSITIPNSVTSIGEKAFSGCNSLPIVDNLRYADTYLVEAVDKTLTTYNIKNGTRWIGPSAFSGCESLTSITIPNSVTSIGNSAFEGCGGSNSLTIGNSVANIGDNAFRGCNGLTSVIWNAKQYHDFTKTSTPFYQDGNGSFDLRKQITSFSFGDEVEYIPAYLCSEMNNITAIIIPNSVKKIGCYAFCDCVGLRTVNMGNQVQSIGAHAFENCTRVNNMSLPNTLMYIGIDAFKNTPFFSSAGEWENGVHYINTCVVGSKSNEVPANLVLREGTTAIYPAAFKNCEKMVSIALPGALTLIPDSAFLSCSKLASIEIPNSVTSIENSAFEDCGVLASIEIPNSVTSIGKGAFSYCEGLTSIEIPNSVTYIGNYAFYYCIGLASMEISNSVTSIEQGTFFGCRSLTSIEIPNSVTSIGERAFKGCSKLTSVEIPNSVTSIGLEAFEGCSSITSVTIGNSITNIVDYAFSGCSKLTSIIWNAKNCMNFNESSTPFFFSHGTSVYYDIRKQITSFAFGEEVEHIPSNLCQNMINLTSIEIPNSVTSIGKEAFSGCKGVKQITIGRAVETIGDNAFDQCPNVMTIYSYLETPPVINNTIFAGFGTYKGVDLYIPTGAKANYEAMDYWKDFFIIEGLPDIIDNKLHYTLDEETQTATLITSSLAELKPVIDGELAIPETVVSNGKTYVVTAVGNNVFKDNSTITTVLIPSTVTQIGDSAFYGSSITSVVIGGTEIPTANDSAARRIVAEDKCCSIGAYAFANCKKLTEITFPKCVNSIGEGAFKGCTALKTIYSEMQNPPVIDETVFEECGDLGNISLVVPVGSEATYKNMTVWKEFHIGADQKTYIITFINWDGTELQKLTNMKEGSMPEYTGEDPTRPEDEEYIYTFSGWSPTIVVVTADATYTATYEATEKSQGIDKNRAEHLANRKILRNGQVFIQRGDKLYTSQGQEVK